MSYGVRLYPSADEAPAGGAGSGAPVQHAVVSVEPTSCAAAAGKGAGSDAKAEGKYCV